MVVGETHHFRKPPYRFCSEIEKNVFYIISPEIKFFAMTYASYSL